MNRNGTFIALALAVGVLLAASATGVMKLAEAGAAARDARANLGQCEHLAERVGELWALEAIASEQLGPTDTGDSGLLELAKQNGIEERQVREIQRFPAESIPESEYQRADTVLQIAEVTMEQIVRFMLAIEGDGTGISVTSLVLRPAGGRSPATRDVERWSGELTLTHLVYAATSPSLE